MSRCSSRLSASRRNSHTSLHALETDLGKKKIDTMQPHGKAFGGTRGSHGERVSNNVIHGQKNHRSAVTSTVELSRDSAVQASGNQDMLSIYGEYPLHFAGSSNHEGELFSRASKISSVRKDFYGGDSEHPSASFKSNPGRNPSVDYKLVNGTLTSGSQLLTADEEQDDEEDHHDIQDFKRIQREHKRRQHQRGGAQERAVSEDLTDHTRRKGCLDYDEHKLKRNPYLEEPVVFPPEVDNRGKEYTKVLSHGKNHKDPMKNDLCMDSNSSKTRSDMAPIKGVVKVEMDDVHEGNEEHSSGQEIKTLPSTNMADRLLSKAKSSMLRSSSSEKNFGRHDSLSNNFRLAKESGKDICVCGASAFWERERISLTTKGIHLEEKSKKLRSEMAKLREMRDRLHSRLIDLERLETDLNARSEVLAAREAVAEGEAQRLSSLSSELKTTRGELDRYSEALIQKERDIEVQRRKQEKEMNAFRDKENLITAETRRLREYSQRLSAKKTELNELEESLEHTKKQLKTIRDELYKKKQFLDARNQELLDVAYNLSEEKKSLEEKEEGIKQEEQNIKNQQVYLIEKENALLTDQAAFDEIRKKLEADQEIFHEKEEQVEQAKEQLEWEKKQFEQKCREENDAWALEMEQTRGEVRQKLKDLEEKERSYKAMEEKLKMSQEECRRKEEDINLWKTTLMKREESLATMEETNKNRREELDHLAAQLKTQQQQVIGSQQEIKEQQAKLTAQLGVLSKEREQMSQELQNLTSMRMTLVEKEKSLGEREKKISQREAVLLSNEARSQWHQNIMKDLQDMKDRYELQLQDFELEKRSFAEMKADVLAEQERAAVALRLREQSIASLEASMRTKHAELLRKERLFNLRSNTHLSHSNSHATQRSGSQEPYASSSTSSVNQDPSFRPIRQSLSSVSRSRHLAKSSRLLNESSSNTATAAPNLPSNEPAHGPMTQSHRNCAQPPRVPFISARPKRFSRSNSPEMSDPKHPILASLNSTRSPTTPPFLDQQNKDNPPSGESHSSASPRHLLSDPCVDEKNCSSLPSDEDIIGESYTDSNQPDHKTEETCSLLPFSQSSLELSIQKFESLVTKDQLESIKLLDISRTSIQESPLITMKTVTS